MYLALLSLSVGPDVRPEHARHESSRDLRRRLWRGPDSVCRGRRLVYDGVFPENAELRTISKQILMSVGLDGAHGVSRRKDGAIAINRNDLRFTTPPHLLSGRSHAGHRTAAAPAECVFRTVPSAARLRHGVRPRHGLGGLGRPLHRRDGLLGALWALDVVGDEGDAKVRTHVARRRSRSVRSVPADLVTRAP